MWVPGSSLRRGGPLLGGGGGLAMDVFEEHEGTHILQSMDGFAISLASDARFLYISETVSIYLGLSQVPAVCVGESEREWSIKSKLAICNFIICEDLSL